MVEMGVAIVAICLPSLRPLVKKEKLAHMTKTLERVFGTLVSHHSEELDSLPHYASPMGSRQGPSSTDFGDQPSRRSEVRPLPIVHLR